MGDYFDEDDLINDYINEDEEMEEPLPPASNHVITQEQDIPEEYEEMLMMDTNSNNNNIKNNHEDMVDDVAADVDAAMSNGERMAKLAETREDNEETIAAISNRGFLSNYSKPPSSSSYSAKKSTDFLYGFHRYNNNFMDLDDDLEEETWRDDDEGGDSFNKRKKKQKQLLKRKHQLALEAFRNKQNSNNARHSTTVKNNVLSVAATLVDFSNNSSHNGYTNASLHMRQQRKKIKTGKQDDFELEASPRYTITPHNSSVIPSQNVDTVALTLKDLSRVYIHVRQHNGGSKKQKKNPLATPTRLHQINLLSKPMSVLLKRVENQKRKSIHKKSLLALQGRKVSSTNINNNAIPQTELWVDKHAPKKFSHLLSDEKTNREVLRAIRQWDPYVFKKDAPSRPTYQKKMMKEEQQKKKKEGESVQENPNDKIRPPPNSRIILLCGSPGIGKTTLAHVLSRHAGYEPFEINASDDRTCSVLTQKILGAMENGLNGRKPKCIILDEMDGANHDKNTVQSILSLVQAEIPVKQKSSSGGSSSTQQQQKKKKSKQSKYLRRPIIMIANHKFAPVLRPFLPHAMVFNVFPPSPQRLVSRIQSILSLEKLQVKDPRLLYKIVHMSGGDIRNCLTSLQFASSGRTSASGDISKEVMAYLGNGNSNGSKDDRSDIVELLETIFRAPRKKMNYTSGGGQNAYESSLTRTSSRSTKGKVFETAEGYNDSQKLMDILFLNIPKIPYADPTMDRASTAMEWISCTEACLLRGYHKSNGGADSSATSPSNIGSIASAIHNLCRIETRPNSHLIYTAKEMKDAHFSLDANRNMLLQYTLNLLSGRAGATNYYSIKNAILDLLPQIPTLLCPGAGTQQVIGERGLGLEARGSGQKYSLYRSVSTIEIMNEFEKMLFHEQVQRLCVLKLTYVRDNHEEEEGGGGQYNRNNMRLDPEIDQLAKFTRSVDHSLQTGGAKIRHKKIPDVVKELLAHAVSLQNVKSHQERHSHHKEVPTEKELSTKQSNPSSQDKITKATTQKDESNNSNDHRKKKRTLESDTIIEENTKEESTQNNNNVVEIKKKPRYTFFVKKEKNGKKGNGLSAISSSKQQQQQKAEPPTKKRVRLSHSGSDIPLDQVVKFKYQKGFTQAVRTPCKIQDFM